MGLIEELEGQVKEIFRQQWVTTDGNKVPDEDDVGLGNVAVKLEATVLYADLAGSTRMVDQRNPSFAAEVYKSYLHCAARLVREHGGAITAYDGDRIMGVFIGSYKNTSAVKCGLAINWAVHKVINPSLKRQYPSTDFVMRQVVGVDTSPLWVARTGVRGANDLVWVGPASNYAAKLTELDPEYATRITERVYDVINKEARVSSDGQEMWEPRNWTDMGNMRIYRSSWWRKP